MNFKKIISSAKFWIISHVSSVKFWIIFLSLLLLALNLLAFLIYRMSHPSQNLSAQLWVYLESDAFKVITASIILPIFLCLLESLFKISAKRKEELKEKQWECIEKTSQIWNQLFSLASEVRYFEKDANKGARIEDILLKLAKFISQAEDVANMWYFRFFRTFPEKYMEYLFSWDNIDKKDSKIFLMYLENYQYIRLTGNSEISKSDDGETIHISNLGDENSAEIEINKKDVKATLKISDGRTYDLTVKKENGKYYISFFMEDLGIVFLRPLNVLLRSTVTVARIIQGNNGREDIPELKNSIELIQGGIKQMAHQPIINILKYTMDLADGGEIATKAKKDISYNLTALKRMVDWLNEIEKSKKLFPSIEGNEVEDFREELKKAENLDDRKVETLKNLFCKIPSQNRIHIKEVPYSTKHIRRLADEMCFYLILEELSGKDFGDYKFYVDLYNNLSSL